MTETGLAAGRTLDDLYRRHGGEVYRYALAVLGNHADAEDVTQTTFLNAYRALEQGVHPRKPTNWLLTIASNVIKERFRREQSRPRHVQLDRDLADVGLTDDDAAVPSVGELLTALSRIPPQQRQALVLREFEGRSYKEIATILGVTTSALETLLFRARRSLTEELEHHLTCTEAQQAISRAADGRIGRKERRRLREHVAECPDCAHFARTQKRHRRALRALALVPIPLSLSMYKTLEGTASAATLPVAAGVGSASGAAAGAGAATTGGGILGGGLALKAAAVAAAAAVAGGATVAGVKELSTSHAPKTPPPAAKLGTAGQSHVPHSQRAEHASAQGLDHGKAIARGQTGSTPPGFARRHTKSSTSKARGKGTLATGKARTGGSASRAKAKTGATAHGSTSTSSKAGARRASPSQSPAQSPSASSGGSQTKGTTSTTDTTSSGPGNGQGGSR